MRAYLTMCRIELQKLRRTLALTMVFVAPLTVVVLQLGMWATRKSSFHDGANLWQSFPTNALGLWAIFMFPMFAALAVGLVYQLDHSSQGWSRLFLMPVPRWTIPAAKLSIALLLMIAGLVILLAATTLAALLIDRLDPRFALPAPPLGDIALRAGKVFLGTILVFMIQNLVSLRWRSMPVSLGVGIGGTFVALFAAGWKYASYHPWLMGIMTLHGKEDVVARTLWLSPCLAFVLAAGTLLYAARRDPARY